MNASSGRSALAVTASSVSVRLTCCLKHKSPVRCRWLAAALFSLCALFVSSCRHKNGPVASDGWQPADQYLAQHPATYKGISTSSRYLTMRDGVKIAVDLSLPAGLKDGKRIPAILRQTRYFRSLDIGWPLSWLADTLWLADTERKVFVTHGYAWVDVDARGTGASFGRWLYPWAPDEVRDGSEVVDWIVKQPWSNGKVGAHGGSYEGGLAEFLLVNKNPAVKASVPAHAYFDPYADVAFPGGIRLSWFIKAWNQGNQMLDRNDVQQIFHDAPWWARPFLHGVKAVDEDRDRSLLKQAVQEHGTNGDIDAGSQVTFRDDVSSVTGVATDVFSPFTYTRDIEASGATVYSWSGWFDGGCPDSAIKRFRTLKNRGRLILGPWNHGASQDASPYSPATASAFNGDGELLRFFDDQLKGVNTGILQEKPVLYFTMGEERWKTADSWPPPGAHSMSYYFDTDHRLATGRPPALDASDHYAVDNTTGTGDTSRWNSLLTLGDVIYPDRSSADQKLLCYTSPPLDQDMDVTGHPVIDLDVSSTATDGEFFAYLEDVDAKAKVTYVTEGELRAVHRKLRTDPPAYNQVGPYHSFKRADGMPLVPGEVAELVFGLQPTSYVFKRGHAIRVALAGADKDHFAVLPGPVPTWDVQRNATHASHIDLPVMLH